MLESCILRGLCMTDESVEDEGDSMDNSELPPVQLRVEPAATALAAAQAAHASREADARRLLKFQQRRRCEEEPIGAASSLHEMTESCTHIERAQGGLWGS